MMMIRMIISVILRMMIMFCSFRGGTDRGGLEDLAFTTLVPR